MYRKGDSAFAEIVDSVGGDLPHVESVSCNGDSTATWADRDTIISNIYDFCAREVLSLGSTEPPDADILQIPGTCKASKVNSQAALSTRAHSTTSTSRSAGTPTARSVNTLAEPG